MTESLLLRAAAYLFGTLELFASVDTPHDPRTHLAEEERAQLMWHLRRVVRQREALSPPPFLGNPSSCHSVGLHNGGVERRVIDLPQ